MAGATLIRAILVACALLAAPAADAQPSPAASGGGASGGGAADGGAADGGAADGGAAGEGAADWFAVEALNPGLPPPPGDLDRDTPMGAVESFLEAVRSGRFDRAAHLLDLSRLAEAEQATRGPELARKLAAVIENDVWLDWSDLPDRPDALVEAEAGGNAPRAGERRRSLLLARIDFGPRDVPLRLHRVRPEGGDPVWVFAPQSVDNIDGLYERHGPGRLQRALPAEWQRQGWLSLRRWEFVALPVAVVSAAALFVLMRWLFGMLARAAPSQAASRAALAARTPLALLAASGPLYWAMLHLVTFSAPVTTMVSPVLVTLMVVAVALAVLRALDRLIEHFGRSMVGDPEAEDDHHRQLYTTVYAVRRIVLLLAFVVGLGVVLMQLDSFKAIGVSLLASAGVLTVILGIAAQPILGNILASLQIALSKPIRIGDSIEYEGRWAYVEAIYFTFVMLRTWDQRRLVVPVQYFTSHPFENYSMIEKKMTRVFVLTLDPRADVGELREAYLEIARADDEVMQEEMLKVLVVGQDAAGIVVQFYCTSADPTTAWTVQCRLRERMLDWVRVNHPEWWPRQRELQETHDDDPRAELRFAEAAE